MTSSPQGSFQARVLIVDDNRFGLSARKSLLKELGHDVLTSRSPNEALELCERNAFDVIVIDYRMPDMNGVEFIASLRKRGKLVPVILISGFTDTLGLNEENTGADVVIQKSANEVNHLIRAINRLLKKQTAKKPPGSQRGTRLSPKKTETS
ncbi:MAG: response regulator [Bryobacteraceae bacterium]